MSEVRSVYLTPLPVASCFLTAATGFLGAAWACVGTAVTIVAAVASARPALMRFMGTRFRRDEDAGEHASTTSPSSGIRACRKKGSCMPNRTSPVQGEEKGNYRPTPRELIALSGISVGTSAPVSPESSSSLSIHCDFGGATILTLAPQAL